MTEILQEDQFTSHKELLLCLQKHSSDDGIAMSSVLPETARLLCYKFEGIEFASCWVSTLWTAENITLIDALWENAESTIFEN